MEQADETGEEQRGHGPQRFLLSRVTPVVRVVPFRVYVPAASAHGESRQQGGRVAETAPSGAATRPGSRQELPPKLGVQRAGGNIQALPTPGASVPTGWVGDIGGVF